MPLFNFRRQSRDKSDSRASSTAQNSSALAESVEVIRRRARYRLIGSAVLVMAGIALFPLLFESQPRPVPADIAVEIQGRREYKPLQLPAAPAVVATVVAAKPSVAPPPPSAATSAAATAPSIAAIPSVTAEAPQAKSTVPNRPLAQATPAQAAIKLEAKPAASKPLPPSKPPVAMASGSPSAVSADDAVSSESARARALLNNEAPPSAAAKSPPVGNATNAAGATATPSAVKNTPASSAVPQVASRAVVQVGAFADAGKASEIRARLEQAGLKSFTQTVETADGKRIRVRVGPFANRAEADKAAAKIRALDMPAAILNQ